MKGNGHIRQMPVELFDDNTDQRLGLHGESRAFVLLESARMRGESLMRSRGAGEHLMAIHREIGMAGFVTCAEFDADHRATCIASASARLAGGRSGAGESQSSDLGRTLAEMFTETIAASDALAGELADRDVDDRRRDRLRDVHTHVMSACELLDERLTVLELQSAQT
jgi:hypothetical protein